LTLTLVNRVFGKAAIDLLPSHLSLIPVAAYLYRNRIEDLESLSVNDLEKIKRWLLLVNFNGYYSARTSPRLQKDLDSVYGSGSNTFPYDELLENIRKSKESAAVIDGADIQEGKFKDILKRPNKSYLFLLYTVLVDNDAEDWMGNSLRMLQMKSLAKAHIFPREELGKRYLSSRLYSELYDEEERELEAKGVNGIGNITLMSREINSEISDDLPANYLKRFHKNILNQHFIPTREDLWNIERFEEFTEERTNLIKDFIKNRYPDIYHESR
jgi:hypothetical protein